MSKKSGKLNYMDPSEQEIAVFIIQNEAVVVLVELFKQGRLFLGHPVFIYIFVINYIYDS